MFRSILVHLTGTDCDSAVLPAALHIAGPFGGHLDCLHMVPDPAAIAAQTFAIDAGSSMLLADTLGAIEQQGRTCTAKARGTFEAFCKTHNLGRSDSPTGGGISVSWFERPAADEFDQLIIESRFHDVVVLAGGPERAGRLPDGAIGSVVMGAGRPVLLASEETTAKPIKTIAVAWKTGAEAARALTAAMPLLAQADRIDVLSANENDSEADSCVHRADRIVQQLRWHGLNAHGRFVVPEGRSVPDAILETAKNGNADLLVMGAYGHSRMRETIFGGFTQRILRGAAIPVLLFH